MMRPSQRERRASGDECDNERETEARQPQEGVCCGASPGVGAGEPGGLQYARPSTV